MLWWWSRSDILGGQKVLPEQILFERYRVIEIGVPVLRVSKERAWVRRSCSGGLIRDVVTRPPIWNHKVCNRICVDILVQYTGLEHRFGQLITYQKVPFHQISRTPAACSISTTLVVNV
jgi:hypothetical protein